MLQETFNDDNQVHLYKYLWQQEEEESLPELASITTNSIASSLRVISMEELPVKKGTLAIISITLDGVTQNAKAAAAVLCHPI
jgi:hypothetical protein